MGRGAGVEAGWAEVWGGGEGGECPGGHVCGAGRRGVGKERRWGKERRRKEREEVDEVGKEPGRAIRLARRLALAATLSLLRQSHARAPARTGAPPGPFPPA